MDPRTLLWLLGFLGGAGWITAALFFVLWKGERAARVMYEAEYRADVGSKRGVE